MPESEVRTMANIRIVTVGMFTRVFIDDKEVDGIRKIDFSQEPGKVPTVKLDLLADKMTIDSPALLALPEVYQGSYEHKKVAVSAGTETAEYTNGLSAARPCK